MLNFFLGKVERFFSYCRFFNPFATLYLNFRTLRFAEAIRLPIFVYGRVEMVCLRGKIIIDSAKIRSGMIKLGKHRDDYTLGKKSKICLLYNDSTIKFKGMCSIGDNFLLRVVDDGILKFGDHVWIGSSVSIFCFNNIEIGDYTSITFNSRIMDSNCHYTYEILSGKVSPIKGVIKFGKFNWIGNSTTIMKGCVTGDYVNVASNSLLNKDYTIDGDSILLAGAPAVRKKGNIRRVFSPNQEKELNNYFDSKRDNDEFYLNENYEDELNGLDFYF